MALFGNEETIKEEPKEVEDASKEEDEQEEHAVYEIDLICDNCGDESTYEINTETTVKKYLENAKCENCECQLYDEEMKKLNKKLVIETEDEEED